MENKLLIHYAEQGLVCPPSLKFNLFTTAAFDNIDHNPSSTVLQQRKIPFTEQLYHYSSTKLVNMMDQIKTFLYQCLKIKSYQVFLTPTLKI